MSTATAVKIPPGEQESLSEGERRAWRGLLRAHACLAKRLDAELEREHGLPMTSYEVLHHLDDAGVGRMRMCDLAEQAQLSRSGLTRLVDRLERDGLLERCSCEHDARGSYACLTDLGRERLAQARDNTPGGRARALLLALLRARARHARGPVGPHRAVRQRQRARERQRSQLLSARSGALDVT